MVSPALSLAEHHHAGGTRQMEAGRKSWLAEDVADRDLPTLSHISAKHCRLQCQSISASWSRSPGLPESSSRRIN
jgi:hypothetical protein